MVRVNVARASRPWEALAGNGRVTLPRDRRGTSKAREKLKKPRNCWRGRSLQSPERVDGNSKNQGSDHATPVTRERDPTVRAGAPPLLQATRCSSISSR